MRKGYIYGIGLVVLGVICFLWHLRHKADAKTDAQIKSTILAPADEAKLIIDPRRHTIVIVTREGTKATFLPRSGAAVTVGKSGEIKTVARTWGTEISPFFGGAFGADIKLRAAAGLNLFYWYRWELGGGLLTGGLRDTRVFMHVSYNLYDSWYLSLGADNRGTAHVMAGLKF